MIFLPAEIGGQWAPPGTTNSQHANGVPVDQEDDAVDVWPPAEEDLAKLDMHLAMLPGKRAALGIFVRPLAE